MKLRPAIFCWGVVLSGALTAVAIPIPTWALGTLAALTGAALGLDSPPDVLTLREAYLMLIGTGLAACTILAMVGAGTSWAAGHWHGIGVRVLGSWTAASAMLALALRLAR